MLPIYIDRLTDWLTDQPTNQPNPTQTKQTNQPTTP